LEATIALSTANASEEEINHYFWDCNWMPEIIGELPAWTLRR
jgi:hypothetical protein